MRVAPAGPPDEPICRISSLRREDVELRALLHAAKDEIHADAATAREPGIVRPNVVFFLDPGLRPRDRHSVIARERFHPLLVLGGPLRQNLFRNGRDAM